MAVHRKLRHKPIWEPQLLGPNMLKLSNWREILLYRGDRKTRLELGI